MVIPTIGRKAYLYEVLKDLAAQTILPQKVIVIEQNPDAGSKSELDYLNHEKWPFEIKHLFTHQTGVCNARNLGLTEVVSHYVFLADDDIRLASNCLKDIGNTINNLSAEAVTISCRLNGEKESITAIKQWHTFGSGCSILKANSIKSAEFNLAYEHGYGEDADFGMQLRNAGIDIIYMPRPTILHLKAPMGGFRTKFKQPWATDDIQPKPSPTVMLFRLLHQPNTQLKGYQLRLFFNLLKQRKPVRIITFVKDFRKSWAYSLKWAAYLKSL